MQVPTESEEERGETWMSCSGPRLRTSGNGTRRTCSTSRAAKVGDVRAGRLVADRSDAYADNRNDVLADDVGIDGAGASAEEAAMHVIDEYDQR